MAAHAERSVGPELVREAAGDRVMAALAALEAEPQTFFRANRARCRVTARISRPFSEIAKVHVDADSRSLSLFVKVARLRRDGPGEFDLMQRRVEHDYEITSRLYRGLPHDRGLSVVRPVACFPHLLTLVTEEAPGSTLLSLAERRLAWWPSSQAVDQVSHVFGRVGQWIKAFQATEASTERVSGATAIAYADVRLSRLADNPQATFSEVDRGEVLRALGACYASVGVEALGSVPIHADLALENVLSDGERIVGLDLSMTSTGTRYHDLAHMFMQVGLLAMKPTFRRPVVRRMQRALLAGYGGEFIEREPFFQALLAHHVACHYLGLVERPAGVVSRGYNAWVSRHHVAWLRRFARESL